MVGLTHGLARRTANSLLAGLSVIFSLGLLGARDLLGQRVGMPKDLRTAIRMLELNPIITVYPVCPKLECHKVFLPFVDSDDVNMQSDLEPHAYPDHCDNVIDGETCEWRVMEEYNVNGETLRRPIKTFVTQSIEDWLAELVKRPDFERQTDNYLTTVMNTMAQHLQCPETHPEAQPAKAPDIWYMRFVHTMAKLWPDGHTGWGPDSKKSLRLLFSLGIDWFNPFGNRIAGKSYSVGAIYLIVNNLPPGVRIQQGNTCLVGILPGPTKPNAECLRWYFKSIVRSLQRLYRGIWYSLTAAYPFGRWIYAMLGPVICDLEAARSVAGVPSHSATRLCSMCPVLRANIGLFHANPESHNIATYLQLAHECRDLPTTSERHTFRINNGVGWSELLRLEYWNPVWFVVVDPMHNLFLGLCQRYFRHALGMDYGLKGWGDGKNSASPGSIAFLQYLLGASQASETRLRKIGSLESLRELVKRCPGLDAATAECNKESIAKSLMQWVRLLLFYISKLNSP